MQALHKIWWLYWLSPCLGTQRFIVGISLPGGILIFSKIAVFRFFLFLNTEQDLLNQRHARQAGYIVLKTSKSSPGSQAKPKTTLKA